MCADTFDYYAQVGIIFGVQGLGFRVWGFRGLGFRGLGFREECLLEVMGRFAQPLLNPQPCRSYTVLFFKTAVLRRVEAFGARFDGRLVPLGIAMMMCWSPLNSLFRPSGLTVKTSVVD